MDFTWGNLLNRTVILQLLLMLYEVYGLQQFSETPQDMDVIKGHTIELRCVVENLVGQIQWAKDGLMLGYDRSIPGFSRYSIVGRNSRNSQEFNLQIENVRLDDDARYECQVAPVPSSNDPGLIAGANLQVLVPPNMPKIINHINGSTVEIVFAQKVLKLTCVAKYARPAAEITWLRNGQLVTSGVQYTSEQIENDKRENAQSVLEMQPKYPDDNNAIYTCQANNAALVSGPLQVHVKLSVQYPPGAPVITGYKHNEAVRVNDTVILICTSTGGNPLAQVAWFRNSMQVDFSYTQRDGKTVNEMIINVERSDNDAEFRCEAWNAANTNNPLRDYRKLVVDFPPKSAKITGKTEAKVNDTVTLTCTTSNSNPAANITWIPQGLSIVQNNFWTKPSPDGGYISISKINVTLTHLQSSTIYTCSATNNRLGVTVSDTLSVGVLYPPDKPLIYGYNEGDSIKAGDTLKMTCRSLGGNPPATLKWFKGDKGITSDINNKTIGNIPASELVLHPTAADNNANYRCEASNRATVKALTTTKKLTVHFPPASVNITSIPRKGRAGQKLTLVCQSASSNPAALITWMYKDKVIQGSDLGLTNAENGGKSSKNKLVILPTPNDNAFMYGCHATNLALNEVVHDGIILDILFKPVFSPDLDVIVISEGASQVINLTARANPTISTYTLLRNNIAVNPGDISSFTLNKGVLTVSGINRKDGGSFTVIGSNTEGVTRHNFRINVHYPAEIYENNKVKAEVGATAELICLVRANPMVPHMISWSRQGFDWTRVLEKYEDGKGTLTIETIEKTDSGTFRCTAHNQIGQAVTKDVKLVVKFLPQIDQSREFKKAASEAGLTGRLICRAEGAPSVDFRWQKDGTVIDPKKNPKKYEIIKGEATNTIHYENVLLVKKVETSDYGIYTCIATNEKGEARFSINFEKTTKPDSPYDISFVNATHNSVTIKWKRAFDGGLEESFRVRYEQVDRPGSFVQVDVQPPDSTVFTVKGLSLGTEYELTVMAFNNLGDSPYQPIAVRAKTSNLKPASETVSTETDETEDTPVMIILGVCVVGVFLLVFNIILILFFVRRRKKRMENGSDTTSHTNTIELYGPSKETALYPMTPSDESRSYGTYDKNMDDDFSDDYKSYEDDDLKRVFLPPPEYGEVTYSHNNMDSPTFEHRHPIRTDVKYPYNGSDTDSCRKSPWRYEDAYNKTNRGKGSFDSDHDYHYGGHMYEPNGQAGGFTRPKSITEMSERSSRPSSRGAPPLNKTPPPPPVRSSSKGAADSIPPLPARNYGSQENIPRYVPPPGSMSSFGSNVNVIANPNYDGPGIRTPPPRQPTDPNDDMRGHLV